MNSINVPNLLPRSVSFKLVVLVPPESPHGVGTFFLIFMAGFIGGARFSSVFA